MQVRKAILQAAVTAAALATLPALAQEPNPWYLGLNLGQSTTDDELVANREGAFRDAINFRTDFDDKDTAWRALVGYRFNKWFSLEANWANYGKSKMNTMYDVPGGLTGHGSMTVDREVEGFGADAVLSWPIWESASVFARLGYFRAETNARSEIFGDTEFADGLGGTTRDNTTKENVFKYGLGAEWMFNANLGARLEWERLEKVGKPFRLGEQGNTGEADMDAWSIGVVWRF